jgi:hypothetical protein
MAITDKDFFTFIADMPQDMKQIAVKQMEALRGMTVAEFKARQADTEAARIEQAEALLSDIEANPDNYATVNIGAKLDEILNGVAVSKNLDRRIGLVQWFISQRTFEINNRDGIANKPHANLTYEEFMKGKTPLKK